ncbi:polysaccharide pyruvyl transferase family protein [Anaerocolumna sedimenticola]|uniref:Polysaccharide pyruvyl transferase family protein n=2 Tax=Anaerocolumna sedimenticola TaxID=2696063 RepID=A0A6P1TQR5_9FIRM|nr:polysaccharide pyruvyl transferase family protein [Anaerocolumna sedimenticola]
MKIGILTHHYINNFGAFLQAYSLQQAVLELRPNDEVYIIDDLNLRHFIINVGGWFRFYKDKENISNWLQKIKLPSTFRNARKAHMNLTKRCYKTSEVNALKLDCIIVGSDEVWNYRETKGNAKIKFGEGLSCNKLIAYAPSVGNISGSDAPEYVVNGIKKFRAVSARDELTEQLASGIRNEKIYRVVDPTFLAYIPDEEVPGINQPYIMFYYCDGLSKEQKEVIFDYAKTNGYAVYGAGENDKKYTKTTVNLTPFQWVWMFRHAKYVVTGTFHGVVFSMLSHRDFTCYMTNPSRIKKVGSLLKEFGLSDRQADGSANHILSILKRGVDYQAFDRVANVKIEQSKEFLQKAIK